jgi:hypothetical protein
MPGHPHPEPRRRARVEGSAAKHGAAQDGEQDGDMRVLDACRVAFRLQRVSILGKAARPPMRLKCIDQRVVEKDPACLQILTEQN